MSKKKKKKKYNEIEDARFEIIYEEMFGKSKKKNKRKQSGSARKSIFESGVFKSSVFESSVKNKSGSARKAIFESGVKDKKDDIEIKNCGNCMYYDIDRELCRERKVIIGPQTKSCPKWSS